MPLIQVEHGEVQAWVAGLVASGLSPSHVRDTVGVLAGVLGLAVRDRRLPSNPAHGVDLPRIKKRRRRYLTAPEVEELADAAGPNGRLPVLVLAYCGLRWCELAALRLGCVDFLRRRFVIAEAMTEVNGRLVWGSPKSHEARSVPIPRVLIDDLAAQVAGKDRDDLVFTTSTGAPLRNRNARRSWFDEAAAAIGKPGLTPRELRHTAASLAVSAGANVKAVQAMLGHASAGECGGGRGVGDDRGRSGDADRVSWGYAAPLVAGLWRGTMCRRLVGDLRPGLRDWSQCQLR